MSDDQAQDISVAPPSQTPVSDQSVSSSSPVSADLVSDTAISDQSVGSAPIDTNRPEPTVSADSSQIPADSSQSPSHSEEPVINVPIAAEESSPVPSSPVPADSVPAPAESPPSPSSPLSATASASVGSSPPESPFATSEENPSESQPQQPDLSAVAAQAKEDINVPLPDNQPSQVQSEPSHDDSTIQAENVPSQSAEIKTEPLESPGVPSTPPENISPSAPTTSFGDLLSSESHQAPPNPPIPSTPSPSAPVSFGDLIKDIKPEESVILPPSVPLAPSPISANPPPESNNPQPISSPSPISPASPPPAHNASQSDAGGLPSSPAQDQAKQRLTILQQKGNQKKKDKRQAMLQKIIDLAKSRGKINNQEAQKTLHLPQSTLSDYFKELVSTGILKKEGKGKATYYHL